MTNYSTFFGCAMGDENIDPYPYQHALATEEWPEVVNIPTGLGKTAAVTLAWLYRRGARAGGERVAPEPELPRRLVWCLPMRVLVEQTQSNVQSWLRNLGLLGAAGEEGKTAVHLLMGGESDLKAAHWARYPEQEAVLIGTQDMLLSRALMRGYGMSRYQWPVHFGLLHNDALWIFDEVQLMGPALPTTTQLEAFRRNEGLAVPARSIWISATLREDWLDTVDFRPYREAGLRNLGLGDADRAEEPVRRRVAAPKVLAPAGSRLGGGSTKARTSYVDSLAAEICAAHVPGEQTLVIVNRVERAQALYEALDDDSVERLLLHARFRPGDRAAIESELHAELGGSGRIVIATQAVEAGVDLDSRVLFTELAPWASMVQRFGRCNRAGRFGEEDPAHIFWIDLDEQDKDLALPYRPESLAAAREQLCAASSAAPVDLPPVTEPPAAAQVIRRRDLMDLFNTDPDLSGFDVDVSPYIRDTGTPQVQVFWREVDRDSAGEAAGPDRAELCPVSVAQLRDHLGKKLSTSQRKASGRDLPTAWRLDSLGGEERGGHWVPVAVDAIRPGQTFMLAAAEGGYDPERGFVPGAPESVAPVTIEAAEGSEGYGSDGLSYIGRRVTLSEHLVDVTAAMAELARALEVPDADGRMLETAAGWHDVGKAHEAFQRGIGFEPDDPEGPWAKSADSGRPRYRTLDENGKVQPRPGFRHELASALAWIDNGDTDLDAAARNLVAYLIAAHHGRVRMGLRALPAEQEPPGAEVLYARGVWAGDTLPALELDGVSLPPMTLRLDLMRLGNGSQGPSWSERSHRLLDERGPFRLAWLEALLRIADWRASAQEAER